MLENPLDFEAREFSCPHCGFNTKHKWYYLAKGGISERGFNYYVGFVSELHLSLCSKCRNFALWLNEKIIYPQLSKAPLPIEDMPLEIKEIFLEAREIVHRSPRATSAFLRLSLRELNRHLGETNRNLELAISNLIKKGLPEKFYDALWAVRVIGKKAVNLE